MAEEWQLIKKIQGLDLTKKCFETDDLEKSEKHEEQIPKFKQQLEDEEIEVFEVKGHQFITENGVYTIVHKTEVQYG